MKIIYDYREKDLIDLSKTYVCDNNLTNIEIEVERLDIGDIIIKSDEKELLIIERKSINDLMSSIKDGRFKEQSMRLNAYNHHNHNIVYLIEGSLISGHSNSRINMNAIYSSMCSILCYKGFSLIRTNNKQETCETIIRYVDYIQREGNKGFYYGLSTNNEESILKQEEELYCSTIKKVKADNINTNNIGEIMLCQIPKISANIAHEIMLKYKTIKNLIKSFEENNNMLQEFSYKNNKDQTKKLTKPAIENIKTYLFNN